MVKPTPHFRDAYRSAGKSLLVIIAIWAVLFMAACGKKGAPTLKSYEKPVAPSNLTCFHRENSIYLQWSYPKDREVFVQGFVMLRAAGTDFEKIGETEVTARSYTDTNILPGTPYRYKVLARNQKGVLSSDTASVSVVPGVVPGPPGSIRFTVSDAGVELSWQALGDGVLYNVYRSTEAGNYGTSPVNSTPLSSSSFIDPVSSDKPVYYTIRGLTDPAARNEGPASREIVVDRKELVPALLTGMHHFSSETGVFLSWNASAETWITGYRIYRRTGGRDYVLIDETPVPAYVDRDTSAETRDYRIHAVGPGKEGPGVEIRDLSPRKPDGPDR